MAFYEKFMGVKRQLEEMGHFIVAPELLCEANGDSISIGTFIASNGGVNAFPLGHDIWKKKSNAITEHFRKIDSCDCILVTNYEKKEWKIILEAILFLKWAMRMEQVRKFLY